MDLRWVLCFVTLIFVPGSQSDEDCTIPSGRETCVCDTGTGIIDLTSLSYNDDNPFFSNYDSGGSNQYFFNPCHPFRYGYSSCSYGDAGVCQDYGSDDVSCGTSSSERIVKKDDGNYYITYSDGTEGRTAEVKLICDPSASTPTFVPYGDQDVQLRYDFDLTTKCACPGTCDGSDAPTDPTDPDPTDPDNPGDGDGSSSSISAGVIGIVVMILLPVALISYFIVGGVILKFKLQKTGTDIIPQKEFWFSLPFLVKDGFVFTFSPIVQLVRRNKGTPYDSI